MGNRISATSFMKPEKQRFVESTCTTDELQRESQTSGAAAPDTPAKSRRTLRDVEDGECGEGTTARREWERFLPRNNPSVAKRPSILSGGVGGSGP
jgi:inorganic triphosphatase YgiF